MSSCTHKTLVLLRETGGKVRCRKCHLVISADELNGGFCPECYEARREKSYDFEPVAIEKDDVTRYRCEECGAMIEWKG
jgi:Zn finger protein HypA/HybF involved in hydrogenase expression